MIFASELHDFVRESWKIEGYSIRIRRMDEVAGVHRDFLELPKLSVCEIDKAVDIFTKGQGHLRNLHGMDVRIGDHMPLRGGWEVVTALEQLCGDESNLSAYELHQRYEQLHPFMDGNGRSGRMIWLWKMMKDNPGYHPTTFLHQWYYQSLENWR